MTPWSSAREALLRRLWDEGLSGGEIGRRLKLSKSAVTGKAHRLKLPPRPSPIGHNGPHPPARLPPLPLESGTCRWVTSEGRPWTFCGAPVAKPGTAWCSIHAAIVYPRRAA